MKKLIKAVCKKCRANDEKEYKRKWDNVDNRLWDEHGYLICCKANGRYGMKRFNINDGIPESCNMVLEHTAIQEETENENN